MSTVGGGGEVGGDVVGEPMVVGGVGVGVGTVGTVGVDVGGGVGVVVSGVGVVVGGTVVVGTVVGGTVVGGGFGTVVGTVVGSVFGVPDSQHVTTWLMSLGLSFGGVGGTVNRSPACTSSHM